MVAIKTKSFLRSTILSKDSRNTKILPLNKSSPALLKLSVLPVKPHFSPQIQVYIGDGTLWAWGLNEQGQLGAKMEIGKRKI